MIAPCPKLDQTVNQIRPLCATGSREAIIKNTPKRGIDTENHLEILQTTLGAPRPVRGQAKAITHPSRLGDSCYSCYSCYFCYSSCSCYSSYSCYFSYSCYCFDG